MSSERMADLQMNCRYCNIQPKKLCRSDSLLITIASMGLISQACAGTLAWIWASSLPRRPEPWAITSLYAGTLRMIPSWRVKKRMWQSKGLP